MASEAEGTAPAVAVDPEEFVRFFAEGWRAPKPDAFIAHFEVRLDPNVKLIQPVLPPVDGIEAFKDQFRNLFQGFPDYEVEVKDWSARENVIYLQLTHSATVGSERRSWEGIDRIVFSDEGLVRERTAYFDPTPLLSAVPGAE